MFTYLKQMDLELCQSNFENKPLIWHYFLQLVSLVYAKTSCCYSLIVLELKNLQWNNCIQDCRTQSVTQSVVVQQILTTFEASANKTLPCLINLTICNLMVRTLGQQNNNYLIKNYVHDVACSTPMRKNQ